MTKGLQGFQKGHRLNIGNTYSKGRIPWNKGKKFPELCGEKAYKWKGGTYIDKDGYQMVYKPGHPFARYNGYILKSRLVMEQHLNRFLTKKEIIHHLNGNKLDNYIENLQLYPSQEQHASDENRIYTYVKRLPKPEILKTTFAKYSKSGQRRYYEVRRCIICKKLHWAEKFKQSKTCSLSCGGKYRYRKLEKKE